MNLFMLYLGKDKITIMRRILKAIATMSNIGNVTTLADPSVVDDLLAERKKMEVEVG